MVRYETKDSDGETRRQRNERFGHAHKNPDFIVREEGQYLFDWFIELDKSRSSGMNGPNPLSSGEIKAWAEFTGNIIARWDFRTLHAMDRKYRDTLAIEQEDIRAREDLS